MALTDEQRQRLRAYRAALEHADSTPTQPLQIDPPRAYLTDPQRAGPTTPLRMPPPETPPEPEPEPAPAPNKGKAVATAFVRHLGQWDSAVGKGIPTPGGIGWLVFALVFLIFAVVPFNGYSRLQWIWMSLTGAATLPGGGQYTTQSALQDLAGATKGAAVGAALPALTNPANWEQIPIGPVNVPVFVPVR